MATERDEGSTEPRRRRRRRRGRRPRLRIPPQVIAFAGVLCAGVLIGWVVFRDDGSTPAPAATTTPAVAVQSRVYPKLGVSLGLPKNWKTSFRQSVLTAVSRDETVSMALSSAGGADAGQRVRRADRTELARLFKARELSRQRAKVGNASTIVTELLGRTKDGRPIRILSMGASSRWRSYSIQVFTVVRPTAVPIAELRTLLASVRFRDPR